MAGNRLNTPYFLITGIVDPDGIGVLEGVEVGGSGFTPLCIGSDKKSFAKVVQHQLQKKCERDYSGLVLKILFHFINSVWQDMSFRRVKPVRLYVRIHM